MSDLSYKEFCRLIGTDKVTEVGETFYNKVQSNGELDKPVSYELISKYFPNIEKDVMSAAEYINNDRVSLTYMNFLRTAYYELSGEDRPFFEPEEGNTTKNFAPIFALLGFADRLEEELVRLKIDKPVADKIRNVFEYSLVEHKKIFGYYGISGIIFSWFKHYLKPDLFPIEELEFEVAELPSNLAFFKNIQTGNIVALSEFEENDECYLGYIPLRGGENGERTSLLKSEYEKLIVPGEDVINVHIPKRAKIGKDSCEQAYSKALEFLNRIFPDKKFKSFCCWSWLMDPELKDMLNEKSNIISFQNFFEKFPVKSSGQEVFVFVHPKPFEKYEDLPENTSLERALKNRYLNDLPIYAHLGVHML